MQSYVRFKEYGDDPQELRPLGGPWTFFKRVRCLCNGVVIEDISEYHRVHELFSILTAEDSRKNSEAEHFGRTWDHIIHMNVENTYDVHNFPGIFTTKHRQYYLSHCWGYSISQNIFQYVIVQLLLNSNW